MSKINHFIGQPVLNQIISLLDKREVRKIAQRQGSDHYTKYLDSYTHLVTMLYAVIGHFDSLREVVIGLLSNAHKLSHLGIRYCAKRSTLSDANKRRPSHFFKSVYFSLLEQHKGVLSDSRKNDVYTSRLYVMDSTTISLFKQILKGAGRNPKRGKKKGGIKAHTLIKYDDQVPVLVNYSSAATHDHILLKSVKLPEDSFITFDMGYVDYKVYQAFSEQGITLHFSNISNPLFTKGLINFIIDISHIKSNAVYASIEELDIPEDVDEGILKDEVIVVRHKELTHTSRRIAYWNQKTKKLEVFMTNNTELNAETIVEIYRRRWSIETLFKQLKQNFPLKYFLGDNVNAIEIQIWVTLIANLLLTIIRKRVKRKWAFSNMIAFIRITLMDYINLYDFLKNPEQAWLTIQKNREKATPLPLFSSQ